MLKIEFCNAKQSRTSNIALECCSHRCHCALRNKSLNLFNLFRRPLERYATRCLAVSFERCCHSVQNLNLLLKRDASEVCSSPSVILKWRRHSLLIDAGEGFLPKLFTINIFSVCSKCIIFISIGLWLVVFTHNKFGHMTLKSHHQGYKIYIGNIN